MSGDSSFWTHKDFFESGKSISVQAEALGGREVVDTPPAHLEEDEGEYQQEKMAAERLDGGLDY